MPYIDSTTVPEPDEPEPLDALRDIHRRLYMILGAVGIEHFQDVLQCALDLDTVMNVLKRQEEQAFRLRMDEKYPATVRTQSGKRELIGRIMDEEGVSYDTAYTDVYGHDEQHTAEDYERHDPTL